MKTIHDARYQRLLEVLLDTRVEAGLTQKELATKLGRPQSFVSKTENAERRLDVIEFIDLCRGLDADPHKLLIRLEKLPVG